MVGTMEGKDEDMVSGSRADLRLSGTLVWARKNSHILNRSALPFLAGTLA